MTHKKTSLTLEFDRLTKLADGIGEEVLSAMNRLLREKVASRAIGRLIDALWELEGLGIELEDLAKHVSQPSDS